MKKTDYKDTPPQKNLGGRRKLPPEVKFVHFGGKIPPAYKTILDDIAAECARKLGEPVTQSFILRLAVECLIMRKRPGLLKTIKPAKL